MAFRDRFFTRGVARAITSPSAILLAGAGTAAAILGGLPIVAAAGVGAAAYGLRVALAVPKAPKSPVDLSVLAEPWRTFVAEAVDARQRYQRALAGAQTGPLRTRLDEIGARLDTGVEESWRIAKRGMALEGAMRQLEDPQSLRRRLDAARRSGDRAISNALQAQLESTERIAAVGHEARQRLQRLDARLDEAVARAVELSLRADDLDAVGGLGSDVDAVVGEMEALRQALEETHRPSEVT